MTKALLKFCTTSHLFKIILKYLTMLCDQILSSIDPVVKIVCSTKCITSKFESPNPIFRLKTVSEIILYVFYYREKSCLLLLTLRQQTILNRTPFCCENKRILILCWMFCYLTSDLV